jgi:hypothetical protein
MGLRGKLMGGNTKILPGQMKIDQQGVDSDDDSTSASTRASSLASSRRNSRGFTVLATPRRGFSQRRKPAVDLGSPTSTDSSRSAWDSPKTSPTTPRARANPFERTWFNGRNDLSHLVAPVQPWNEYIESYAKNLVEKVGGTQKAWTNVMFLNSGEVRKALYLNGTTPRNSNKPRPLPQEVARVLHELLISLPPSFKNDTAKLCFALQERPFYTSAMEKHVELVLWGIVSSRNNWM